MSIRGRNLFNKYVREQLSYPVLRGLGVQSHVHNLLYEARAVGIPPAEIEEEVGPLLSAVWVAKTRQEAPELAPPTDPEEKGSTV